MSRVSEIYSQGYEKWEGDRSPDLPAWFLIGRAGVKNIVSSSGRISKAIFFIGFTIYYFTIIVTSLARFQLENLQKTETLRDIANALNQIAPDTSEAVIHMHHILFPSIAFCIFAMMFYGSQLISKDKASNALQVYFSKAISRTDYLLGKFFAVSIITSLVSLVPSAIILLIGLLFTTDHLNFFAESWHVPIITGVYWLFITAVFGSITLFFSSSFNKSYMAAVSVVGFMLFCFVVYGLMTAIFGSSNFIAGFNWLGSIALVGEVIYTMEVNSFGALFWRMFDLAAICGVCVYLMLKKIEPVEVVK